MSETALVRAPEEVKGMPAILEAAREMEIVSQEAYDEAGRIRREIIKPKREEILAWYEPRKKKAREVWQGMVNDEKGQNVQRVIEVN